MKKSKSKAHLVKKKIVNKRGVLTTVLVNPDKDGVISAIHSAVKGIMSWLSKLSTGDEKPVKGVSVKKVGDDAYKLRSVDGHDLHHGTFTKLEAANHINKLAENEDYHRKARLHAKHRHEAKQPLKHRIARFMITHGGKGGKASNTARAQAKDIAHAIRSVDHVQAKSHAKAILDVAGRENVTHKDLVKVLVDKAQKMTKSLTKHADNRQHTAKLAHYLGVDSSKLTTAFGHLDLDDAETHVDAALKILDYVKERVEAKRSSVKVPPGEGTVRPPTTRKKTETKGKGSKFPFSRGELAGIVEKLTHLAGLDEEHAKPYTMIFSAVSSPLPKSGLQTVTDSTVIIDTSEPVPYKGSGATKGGINPTNDELRAMAKLSIKVPADFVSRFNVLVGEPEPYKTGGFVIKKNGRFIDVTEPSGRSVRMPGPVPDAIEQAARFVRLRYDQLGGAEGAKRRRLEKQKERESATESFKQKMDEAPKSDNGVSMIGDHQVGVSSDGNYYIDGLNIGKNPDVADRLVSINRSVGGYESMSTKDLIAEGKSLASRVVYDKSSLTLAIADKDADAIEREAKNVLIGKYRIAEIKKQLQAREKNASPAKRLTREAKIRMMSEMDKGQQYRDDPPETASIDLDGVRVERLGMFYKVNGLEVEGPENAAALHEIASSYVGREYPIGTDDADKLRAEVESLNNKINDVSTGLASKIQYDGIASAADRIHSLYDLRGKLAATKRALADTEREDPKKTESEGKEEKVQTVRLRNGKRVRTKKVSQLIPGDVIYDSFAREHTVTSVVKQGKRFIVKYGNGKPKDFKGSMYIGVKNG